MSCGRLIRRRLARAAAPLTGLVAAAVIAAAGHAAPRQTVPDGTAPPASTPTTANALSVEGIEARLRELEPTLEQDPAAAAAAELYRAALAELRATAEWRELGAASERSRQAAAGELEQVQAELARPLPTRPDVPPDATLEQIKQLRDQAEAALRQATDREAELVKEKQVREQRRAEIPTERQRLVTELEELEDQLAGPPTVGEQAPTERAAALRQMARAQTLRAQLEALERELANYEARRDLLPLRQEQWKRRREAREKLAAAWREEVSRAERRAADEEARAARAAMTLEVPELQAIAERSLELIELKRGDAGVIALRTEAERTAAALNALRRRLVERFHLALARARAASGADVADVRLRRERGDLPALRELQSSIDERRAVISATQLALSDLQYELETLPADLEHRAVVLNGLPRDTSTERRAEIATELDRLLAERRTRYRSLIQDYEDYLNALLQAQEAELEVLRITQAFRDFIDERILWIRSAGNLLETDAAKIVDSFRWLLSPSNWLELGKRLLSDALRNPLTVGLRLLALLGLLLLRHKLIQRLERFADGVKRLSTDRMMLSFRAVLVTVLLAIPVPGLLWLLSWRLQAMAGGAGFETAVASGLTRLAALLITATLLWELCRPRGIVDAHFRWRKGGRLLVRRTLAWFAPLVAPFAFAAATLDARSGDGTDQAGRLAFIAAMILLSIAIAVVIRPSGGILDGILSRKRGGWLDRLRYAWYTLAVSTPLVLGSAAGLGYFYTAVQFERRLVDTLWLVLIVVFVEGLVLRWLLLTRRRLALKEAQKRAAEGEPKPVESESGTVATDELKLDIDAINAQARQLLQTVIAFTLAAGLWLIWSGMLPALGILDRVELWPNFGVRSEVIDADPIGVGDPGELRVTTPPAAAPPADAAASADGVAVATEPARSPAGPIGDIVAGASASAPADATAAESSYAVTLADLIMAIVIALLTFVISRNLPGLLEITLLQRLPLEPSGRYATTTIVRYLVIIVGLVLSFNAIGIGWSKVQWLLAAITLGVGFGLQEIVANFISGLIILFEQPIRVGDTVTVGDVSGSVSRIRMRATTIIDWDRKELIIPNKEFVTGRIINWSLSDSILRVRLPVGIAYGSDTQAARRLALEVARNNPRVLSEPRPQVIFWAFGDSSLNFEVRVFVPHIDHFVAVRDELHEAIDQAFRKAGIEIAFPQRDLHLRSIAPGATFASAAAESVDKDDVE